MQRCCFNVSASKISHILNSRRFQHSNVTDFEKSVIVTFITAFEEQKKETVLEGYAMNSFQLDLSQNGWSQTSAAIHKVIVKFRVIPITFYDMLEQI